MISVFKVNPNTGIATRDGAIPVPPPASAPAEQQFPPGASTKASWPIALR